jgi:tetratricopeptide (TPR) repeat protein
VTFWKRFRTSDHDRVGGGWSRRSRKRSKRLLKIGAIAAIIIVLGLLVARPVRNLILGWQARRHAETAFGFIEQKRWKEAREETTAAYQLRPNEPEAIRAVARLLSRTGNIEALNYWRMLSEKTKLTRADLRDKAAIALKAGEPDQTRDAINRLLGGAPGEAQPADWLLAGQAALQERDFDVAYNQVNKVFASNSASTEEQLQAVSLLQAISHFQNGILDPVVVRRLDGLARGQDNAALEALTVLAFRRLNVKNGTPPSPGDLSDDEIVHLLQSHPLGKPFHKLTAASLRLHSHPSERNAVLKEMIDRWKGGDNADLAALANWLNSQGEYQRELDVIPENRAMQTRELFSQYVDTLGKLGRWSDIRRLIESEQFPLDPMIEHMYLAQCLSQQGETAAAKNSWSSALQEAAGDANKLMALADYAEKHSAYETAMLAYEAALIVSPRLRSAQEGRLRVASDERDTEKVQEVLSEMLQTWPNDFAALSDDALIRLLRLPPTGADPEELDRIEKTARALIRREPENLSPRTVLALAYLREGRPSDAMVVYSDYRGPDFSVTPAALAVHAAVLAANNRLPEAKKEAAQISETDLLPEECLLTKF